MQLNMKSGIPNAAENKERHSATAAQRRVRYRQRHCGLDPQSPNYQNCFLGDSASSAE